MALRSMGIAPRAGLCFAVITLLVVILGGFAFVEIRSLRAMQQDLEQNWLVSIQTLDAIQIAMLHMRLESIRLLESPDQQARRTTLATLAKSREELDAHSAFYRDNVITAAQERAEFAQASALQQRFLDGVRSIIELSQTDREKALVFANTEQPRRAKAYQQKLDELRDFSAAGAKASGVRASGVYELSITIIASVVVAALLLTGLLAVALTRSIVQPMQASLRVAERIANGDLTHTVEVSGNDEAARLQSALRHMQKTLRDTLQSIAQSSSQLSASAVEMAAISEDATRVLQQQNSEIDQAATAVNQMSAAVEEVARNANAASESARRSSAAASAGNTQVGQTLAAMRGLSDQVEHTGVHVQGLADQTQNIAQVLSVIRSIAEQTNLLALNAAIEAARAGEQGRGFAVVADEVRALAHRTQRSTAEIERMISTIQGGATDAVTAMQRSNAQAHDTHTVAENAGRSLQEIINAAEVIEARNLQIAAASQEQAHVAHEVDRSLISIRNLSVLTRQGTAHTRDASQAVSQLAIVLDTLVKRFKV